MSEISTVIREDSVYKRSKKRLNSIMENIDIKMLTNELFSLHNSRVAATLKTQVIIRDSVQEITGSTVDEIATRSRCTTIKMTALKSLLDIEEITRHLSKYILSKYAKQLKANGDTTITAQKATVDVYLRLFIESKNQLEGLMKLVDLVLDDVDQTSYGLSRIEKVLELASKDR